MNTLLNTATGGQLTRPGTLEEFGEALREATDRAAFKLYRDRRPEGTQRAQRAAVMLFHECLQLQGYAMGNLFEDPLAWQGITSDMAHAFREWLLWQGYSMGTINGYFSTVKTYLKLANQAGVISDSEIIRLLGPNFRGYARKEIIDLDTKRAKEGIATRHGAKKCAPTLITKDQARALCRVRNDSPQARRDALLMCLLLDHGMRVSEVEILKVEDIDMQARQVVFYRPKTGKTSRHNLRGRAWQIMTEYLSKDNQAQNGPLILASSKSGSLIPGRGMTTRAIRERVKQLGASINLFNLSPHDCRHYGATQAGNDPSVSLAALMAWGGWDSAQSAARYIHQGQADNDGVSLGMDGQDY
jgi:integrase